MNQNPRRRNHDAAIARGWLRTVPGTARACRLYRIWRGMISRCTFEGNPGYIRYGARGIRVRAEWYDYAAFRAWAVANGYRKHLSLDRINNDGNYESRNCRWATATQQARNTRKTHLIDGHLASDLARTNGICRDTMQTRLNRGWDIRRAVTTKPNKYTRGK